MNNRYLNRIGRDLRIFMRNIQLDTDNKFLLEINGDGILKLSGVSDIIEYDDAYISVVSEKALTDISGKNMVLDIFNEKKITVSGQIDAIKFIYR